MSGDVERLLTVVALGQLLAKGLFQSVPLLLVMCLSQQLFSLFSKIRFYVFIFREGGREGEKRPCARDTLFGCLSHTPNRGPGSQRRHVP